MRTLYEVWPSALSADDVARIIRLGQVQAGTDGTIFSTLETMQDLRSCTVRWIDDPWLRQVLWEFVQKAIARGLDVDVQCEAEIQLVEYNSQHGDHYGWHHDVQWNGSSGLDRKLSLTVQLSGGDEYVGGEFEFEELSTNADFREIGTVLLFPSYLW